MLEESEARSVLGAGGTPLLILEDAADAPPRHPASAGLYHIAFRVPSRAALGDALARIRTHWQLGGASDHWVSEALYLTDPEGNGIEIYRDFPRGEWPRRDDGRVRISTEPLDLDRIDAAATGDAQAPPETDIGHIHLEVASLDAFRELYVETLGFEVQISVPAAAFVAAGGYHHHIGANTWHHRTTPVSGRGVSWFEVVLPDTIGFDALRDRLASSQITVTETTEGISITDADELEVQFRIEP